MTGIAFAVKEKIHTLKVMMNSEEDYDLLFELEWMILPMKKYLKELRFVFHIDGKKSTSCLNEWMKFPDLLPMRQKTQYGLLPTCEDVVRLHTSWANYHAWIP